MCDSAFIVIDRKAKAWDKNPRLGNLKIGIENLPLIESARRRLQDAIRIFEKAQAAKPDGHTAGYLVEEQKRSTSGMLSMATLPNATILLSEDPADPVARNALMLVSAHGTNEDVMLAAVILLDARLLLHTRVELPILENSRRRLQDAISRFEKAGAAKPDNDPASGHLVEEQRRMSCGFLSMTTLPDAIILLSENPTDPVAKKALRLVSEHGTNDEIKLAARILLERTTGR